MTPTLTSADLVTPRIGTGTKIAPNRPESGSTPNLDALMSAWVAIFQQQLAPAIPAPELTPAPERVELSLTRNAESTPDASDTKSSDVKTSASPATSLDSLLASSVKLVALPVSKANGDEVSDPLKAQPAAELTPKAIIAQPSGLTLLARRPAHLDIVEATKTTQPVAPSAASSVAPVITKNATVVAPQPPPGSLSEIKVPAGEWPALRTEVVLMRSIPQRIATKGNEVVAKFLSENSMSKVDPQRDATVEPTPEDEAVDPTSVRAEQAPSNDQSESPLDLTKKELPAQFPSPIPVEPHAPAPSLMAPTPPTRLETSPIDKAPPPPPETPVARPAPPPQIQQQPTPSAAKTISIRIPFTSPDTGQGAQHIDLIFQNRNNDLTLQLHSPTTEIQQRIEESMPTLMGKLQTADWTAKPSESSVVEPMPDSRKRAEAPANSSPNFASTAALAQSESSAQSGSRFDQNNSNRKEHPTQAQPGRNPKKDRAWQFEIDSETES